MSARGCVLEAVNVEVNVSGTQILSGASLSVRDGEVHVLIGPNGAGKTTFANVITGHMPLTAGELRLREEPLAGAVFARARRGIGRKFQVPRVFGRLTSHANVIIAERRARASAPGAEQAASLAADDDDIAASELSHGERQRLELQMVLAQGPDLAVLDEPTAGMTRAERNLLAGLIRELAGRQTFLIVEHDMDFVELVADTVSFMQEGRVTVSGSFATIAADPTVRAAYLGAGGHGHGARRNGGASERGGSLQAAELTVRRGHLDLVRGVGFELGGGGALGVLGRNGAGKTTLLSGLMGLLDTTGTIVLDGEAVHGRPAWWRSRHGIALVPQGRQLFPDLTVAENLAVPRFSAAGAGPEFDLEALFPALGRLMARKAGYLSGGEQQQVAIARALLRRPRVLLLDEPTEGLSPRLIGEIVEVLEHLVEQGLTIVLAEQHRAVVEQLCTSFLVLRSGDMAGQGALERGAIDAYYQAI